MVAMVISCIYSYDIVYPVNVKRTSIMCTFTFVCMLS